MLDFSASQHTSFLDHQAVQWSQVRRARFLFYQRFQYEYPGPIENLKQRLIVFPTDQYGTQVLRDHVLEITPQLTALNKRQAADPFGNRVLEVEVPQVEQTVSFETLMIVEHDADLVMRPTITQADAAHFLKQTRLTTPDARIKAVARQLSASAATPYELAGRIHAWVHGAMRYAGGVTTVATTAAQALAVGAGLCQDYAHLMLSICREAGLPARYVSGHLMGEGGSHAWVEVILPTEHGLSAFAFDPTNDRQPHLGYVTVAVGRDYRDISPTSGSFTAPYGGQLTCSKRAGLTRVEFLNGEILSA